MKIFSVKQHGLAVRWLPLLTTLVFGCNSGGDSAGIGGTGEPVRVSSTVGGTGYGTITGFGSIIINGDRHFEVTGDTKFIIDDDEFGEAGFRSRAMGMVARFNIGTDVNDDLTGGTAISVEAENVVMGAITDVTPLTVMGLPVVTTADTVLVNVPGGNTGSLAVGDVVEVSGYSGGDNVVDATRIEYKSGGLSKWELNGYVSNYVAATSFAIGAQNIIMNGVMPEDCGSGLANGMLVEVKATPDSDLTALDTVIGIECKQAGLRVPEDVEDNKIAAEIEGIVSAVNPGIIVVQGQNVQHDAGTEFEGGTLADIVAGSRIEVEGEFNVSSGILMAGKIRLRQSLLRIEAPVNNADITAGQSLVVLGATVRATTKTRDEDGIFSGGLSSATRQVEVLGIVDGGGTLFATEVKDIGSPKFDDVRIRGPVTGVADPLFEVAGIVVDSSTAQELEGGSGFFNRIREGTSIKIEEGVYDSATGVVNDAKVSIED